MPTFSEIQNQLNRLIPLPANLPVIYLLGDTGAGKTCVVRQFLGTANQNFPPALRLRTTVAPTEFIVTNDLDLRGAFIFKPASEVLGYISEILEQAVTIGMNSDGIADGLANVTDALGDSPDQRFRLRCFLGEEARAEVGLRIVETLVPRVQFWINANFPAQGDRSIAVQLALETEFQSDIHKLRVEIMQIIVERVNVVCSQSSSELPETFFFESTDKNAFVQRLKTFLSVGEGSISPVVEKARIRGALRSPLLSAQTEIVVIDGEGIGHDARESRVLSARHLDYFSMSDAIILVEDAETPFRAGGKGAIAMVAKTGHLPKFTLAFSRLDRVQTEQDGRGNQIREVERSLRNVLHALADDNLHIARPELDVRYFGNMNQAQPDQPSALELSSLAETIVAKHAETKARFIAPIYDFELLVGFLVGPNTSLRRLYAGYIRGDGATPAPWQTQKAFSVRMDWKQDEYRYLKPVAEFASLLLTDLCSFLERPTNWTEDVTKVRQRDSVERLKQEVTQRVLSHVREALLEREHSKWSEAAQLRGPGSTQVRRDVISAAIGTSAPELTGIYAREFKDAIKELIEAAIEFCRSQE